MKAFRSTVLLLSALSSISAFANDIDCFSYNVKNDTADYVCMESKGVHPIPHEILTFYFADYTGDHLEAGSALKVPVKDSVLLPESKCMDCAAYDIDLPEDEKPFRSDRYGHALQAVELEIAGDTTLDVYFGTPSDPTARKRQFRLEYIRDEDLKAKIMSNFSQ